jgi:hypothetical protein
MANKKNKVKKQKTEASLVIHRPLGTGMVRSFVRAFDFDTLLVSGVTVNSYDQSLGISLAAFPSSGEFTALFDQYRIREVEVRFISPYKTQQLAATPYLMLHTVNDYDDYTAVIPNVMQENETYRQECLSYGRDLTRRFVPKVAMAAYSGAFTSYANVSDQWIDCGSPNVQYYGLKYSLEMVFSSGGRNTNVLMNFATCVRTVVTARLEFRAVR